jgi:hypothetical protein
MVRRHGKKPVIAREEKKKRERGESSTRLDELGTRAPKRQGRVDQRLGKHTPGSSLVYSQF